MIQINMADIGPDGLMVNGTEDSSILEFTPADRVKADGQINYHLTASKVGQDLLVMGKASVKLEAECDFCLAEFQTLLTVPDVCIHIEKPASEIVDITQLIREDLLLALPVRFKCSEECKGLCPGCGADLNHEKCRCSKTKKKKTEPVREDHTWDALDGLKF